MVFFRRDDEEEELDTPEDEDAALADEVLDEVEVDSEDLGVPDEIEGFGLITEEVKEDEEDEEDEDGDGDESLEDDAEDVDFDTFDDVDEM